MGTAFPLAVWQRRRCGQPFTGGMDGPQFRTPGENRIFVTIRTQAFFFGV